MRSKAKITITRNLNNQNQIYITITDDKIRKVVEVMVTPEQLALALTGLGYQDCEIERW